MVASFLCFTGILQSKNRTTSLLLIWTKILQHFVRFVMFTRCTIKYEPSLSSKQCRRYGKALLPTSRLLESPFWFAKILFLEYHVTTRQPTMTQKGIITFSPTYLTKVAYISSILKFLNTDSLEVKFQIQALTYKFYTFEPIRSSSIIRPAHQFQNHKRLHRMQFKTF